MGRFTKSFSVNYAENETFVANRMVSDLEATEGSGRGEQVALMRRKMMIGQMVDEISKGLGDSLLNLDDSGVFVQMDKAHKAEWLIEMIKSELAQQQLLDSMIGKAKPAQQQPIVAQVKEPEPEIKPGTIKSQPVEIAEYQEPEVKQEAGPLIMEPANIFA